jgi:hypothetical protein
VLALLGAIVFVELVYLSALALFTPPTERDALSYHLARALLWIQQGSVGHLPDATDSRLSDFPVDAEIAQGATMLLSQSVRWAALVQFAALLVAMVAIYGIARRIGLDEPRSAFGALVFPTLPVVALQAPTALNDLLIGSLIAVAAFFVLGRSSTDAALAAIATSLLVGTKGTGLLGLPLLVAIAAIRHRGRELARSLVWGAVGVVTGAAWLIANATSGRGMFGEVGDAHRGDRDGALAMVARATRYLVEAFELPGAPGKDRFLYVLAALVVLGSFLALRQTMFAIVACGLTLLPLLVLPAERALHSIYFNGWELVGYRPATELGIIKVTTNATNVQSWYGPVGVVLWAAASVLVVRAARHRSLPPIAVLLAAAPLIVLVGVTYAVPYFDLNGRFLMGGVAVSAATWGVVKPARAAAVAVVAVAATTVFLTLVNYREKPAGVDLLEGAERPSIWTLPREWAQSIEPEVARVIGYTDDHVPPGAPVGVSRGLPYLLAYAGYPNLVHRVVYADSLDEASARGVDWVVLPLRAPRAGWLLVLRSPPWGVYRNAGDGQAPG